MLQVDYVRPFEVASFCLQVLASRWESNRLSGFRRINDRAARCDANGVSAIIAH